MEREGRGGREGTDGLVKVKRSSFLQGLEGERLWLYGFVVDCTEHRKQDGGSRWSIELTFCSGEGEGGRR